MFNIITQQGTQFKTTMRYNFTLIMMDIIKKWGSNVEGDIEKLKHSDIDRSNLIQYSIVENVEKYFCQFLKKSHIKLPYIQQN